jgi:hypothetical protein
MTVTIWEAVVWLPAASVAVYVIEVVPTGNTFPAGIPVRATETTPEQLSFVVADPSAASLTTVPHEVEFPVETVTFDGAASVGAVVSLIVTVVVAELVLPTASVAVIVIEWVPTPTRVPAAGLWVKVTLPLQLSDALLPATTFGIAA